MSIVIGNDEFILYVRKHNQACKLDNETLGKQICEKIKSLDPNAKIVEENKASYWDLHGVSVAKDKLPATSAQMEFDREILPKLYDFLDQVS
jgi:hypothetical protein